MFLIVIVIPESPRYLNAIGRYQAAQDTLNYISKFNKVDLPPGKLKCVEFDMSEREPERRGTYSVTSIIQDIVWGKFLKDSCVIMYTWFACSFIYYGLMILSSPKCEFDCTYNLLY